MFTPEERTRLRTQLVERGGSDGRITGVAITGSCAAAREDAWSDIDLAFGVRGDARMGDVLRDWTDWMYGDHGALHHVDIQAGPWTYRVFLLANTLQVDLAFVVDTEFRAMGPEFHLVCGSAREAMAVAGPGTGYLIGFGWLYALHARSSIARGKLWQAEYMISGMRDTALSLACVRHGLPASLGRGLDGLPGEVSGAFAGSLVRGMEEAELARAYVAAVRLLMKEVRLADAGVAARLEAAMAQLAETEFPAGG